MFLRERALLKTILTSSTWSSNLTREADVVATNGDAISVGIFLLRVDLADNFGVGDFFATVVWVSFYLMTKKVLVALTCLPFPSGLVPIPWQSLSSLLEQDSFHMAWNLG